MLKLKRILTILLLIMWSISQVVAQDHTNGKTREIIIGHTTAGQSPHIVDVLPTVLYFEVSHILTIEFPTTDFEPYTITLASTLVEMDYYVTTPFVSLNVAELVGYTVNINMETDGGDLYWGSFDATSGSSTE